MCNVFVCACVLLTVDEDGCVASPLGVMAAGGAVLHGGHHVHHFQQRLVDEHILSLHGWVWSWVGVVMGGCGHTISHAQTVTPIIFLKYNFGDVRL